MKQQKMTLGMVSLLPCLITLSIFKQAAIACSHVERTNFWTGETRCCIYVECQPNFYVKECEVDNTADTCEPCPAGSFMFDRTDSHFPFQCRRYSCPPGKMAFLFFISPSRQVNYLFDISSLIRLL